MSLIDNSKNSILLEDSNKPQWYISAGVDVGNNPYILLQDVLSGNPISSYIDLNGSINKKLIGNKLIIKNESTYIELNELNCTKDILESVTFSSAYDILAYINDKLFIF